MKTIVYIVNQLRKAGPIVVLKDIIANLDRDRFRPVIIKFMNDDWARSITHQFKEMQVEIYEMNLSFWSLELQTGTVAHKLDLLLNEIRPNIIHTHGYHPVLVVSRIKYPCFKMETLHCISSEDFVYSKGYFLGHYMNWRYLKRLYHMDYCAAISKTIQNYYKMKLPESNIRLVYNGVDEKVLAEQKNKEDCRIALGLPLEKTIFLVVGTLGIGKDPETIIKAFKQSSNREMSLLIFLGQGPLKQKCQDMTKNDPDIVFGGYVFNVFEYLRAADYSICASRSEGFGLNFIESLMAGTPVIGSKIGPFNEFTALYPMLQSLQFTIGDVSELTEKINSAVTNPIEVETIIPDITKRFSAVSMAQSYMRLYNDLIGANGNE